MLNILPMLQKLKIFVTKPSVLYVITIILVIFESLRLKWYYYTDFNYIPFIINESLSEVPPAKGLIFVITLTPLLEEFIFRYWIGVKRGFWSRVALLSAVLAFTVSMSATFANISFFYYLNDFLIFFTEHIGFIVIDLATRIINIFLQWEELRFLLDNPTKRVITPILFSIFLVFTWDKITGWKVVKNILNKITLPKIELTQFKLLLWQIVISCVAFSLLHDIDTSNYLFSIYDFSLLFITSLTFTLIRIKHGLWASIALHSLWNVIASFKIYQYDHDALLQRFDYDFRFDVMLSYVVTAIISLLAISYIIYKTFFDKGKIAVS